MNAFRPAVFFFSCAEELLSSLFCHIFPLLLQQQDYGRDDPCCVTLSERVTPSHATTRK